MLERLLPFWQGKLFVLVLLGFAATDFIITMTLSAADATAHLIENPHVPAALHGQQMVITLRPARAAGRGLPQGLHRGDRHRGRRWSAVYLALNVVVVVVGLVARSRPTAAVVTDWTHALTAQHGNPLMMVGVALLVFPKLALGLSGFETGVAVMPHVEGDPDDTERPARRPDPGHPAAAHDGRADHERLPDRQQLRHHAADPARARSSRAARPTAARWPTSPTSTSAAASARSTTSPPSPSSGSPAPRRWPACSTWSRATCPATAWRRTGPRAVRPLVLVLTAVAFLITWLFDADVDAQGGAYATGVLVLITSAAVAVTLSARGAGSAARPSRSASIAAVFALHDRRQRGRTAGRRQDRRLLHRRDPAGVPAVAAAPRLRAAGHRASRWTRWRELFIRDCARRTIRLVANEPDSRDGPSTATSCGRSGRDNDLPDEHDVIFVEVTVTDPSDFESGLDVRGEVAARPLPGADAAELHGAQRARRAAAAHPRPDRSAPAHLLRVDRGQPGRQLAALPALRPGEVAPVTREVLREAEPDRARRPRVHVG